IKIFELYQAVLTIKEFSDLHLEEYQEQFLFKIFEHWNKCDKLIEETTDNNKLLAIKDRLGAYDNILEAYFASYLDPQFKNWSLLVIKQKAQDILLEIIKARANAIDIPVQTKIDQLYNDV
ncbi:9593_t:CDS:2, partial [Racocetra persica]